MFELQCNLDGQQHSVGFDRFVRVGSSADCEVNLPDATLAAKCLLVINEGPKGFRAMVKTDGVLIDQQPYKNGASLYIQPGAVIQIGTAVVTLATRQVASAPVVPRPSPQKRAAPQPTEEARNRQPAEDDDEGKTGAINNADLLAIVGIVFCLALVLAGVWWTFLRDSPDVAEANIKTLTTSELIGEIREIEEWTLLHIGKEDLIAGLRNAYQLEARKQTKEAKAELTKLRAKVLRQVPTDENGNFNFEREASSEDQAGKLGSVTDLWFEDKFAKRLFTFLSTKIASL